METTEIRARPNAGAAAGAEPPPRGLTRRALLARGAAFGTTLKPETMATLIQMARDIYPHDRLADRFYAVAVKGYDDPAKAEMVETGIAALDAAARGRGFASYAAARWESDRTAILQDIERGDFFQTVRSGLVTGLYNQKEVWPLFGYEGESYSKGGYINRGFDDIDWL